MWIGDFYIKPLYLLIAVALIILIVVVAIVKKILAAIITLVILALLVYGGNSWITRSRAENFARLVDIGKNSYETVADLVTGSNVRLQDGKPKVRIDGTWYDFEKVRENVYEKDGKFYFDKDGKTVAIEDPELTEFFRSVNR